MPGSVDHCWTTPNLWTNGDVDPCEEFILQFAIWGPAPFVTLVQQPEVVNDTFYLHPLTKKRHLKYWLALKQISSDNMVEFVTDVVQRVGVFGKLIQCTMPVSSIPSPCITPLCVLSHCPFHYYPVVVQGLCAQGFQIYSDRKLTDRHFQEKMWPISVHPCQLHNCLLIKLLRQNWVSDNLMLADKSICEKMCFCFEIKILQF